MDEKTDEIVKDEDWYACWDGQSLSNPINTWKWNDDDSRNFHTRQYYHTNADK